MAVPPPPPPRPKKSSGKGGLVVLLHRWIFGRENPLGPATSLTHTTTPPLPCTVYPEIDFAYVRLIRNVQPFISHSKRKKFATFSKVWMFALENVPTGSQTISLIYYSRQQTVRQIFVVETHTLFWRRRWEGFSDPFHVCCCCYLVFNP